MNQSKLYIAGAHDTDIVIYATSYTESKMKSIMMYQGIDSTHRFLVKVTNGKFTLAFRLSLPARGHQHHVLGDASPLERQGLPRLHPDAHE